MKLTFLLLLIPSVSFALVRPIKTAFDEDDAVSINRNFRDLSNQITNTNSDIRILRERSSFVNVKDSPYNAVGDGSTDDLTSIQAALNTGLNVFIPTGTYKLTNNIYPVSNGQIIQGAGRDTTLKFYHATSNPPGIASAGRSHLTIRDLNIDGSNLVFDVAARGAIHLGDGTTCDHNLIENIHILNWQGVGVLLSGVKDTTVKDCYVYRSYEHSFYLAGGTRCVIDGNRVEGAGYNSGTSDMAMKVATFQNSSIVNNIILDSTSTAVQFQAGCNGTIFANNQIINTGASGAQLLNVASGEFGLTIIGNYLKRTDAAVAMKAENADRIKIAYNMFDLPSGAGGLEAYSASLTNSVIMGNVFKGGGNATGINLSSSSVKNSVSFNVFEDFSTGIAIAFDTNTSSNTAIGNIYTDVGTRVSNSGSANMVIDFIGSKPFFNQTAGVLILKSPDGTCSSCGPDNTDTWACSSVTCP